MKILSVDWVDFNWQIYFERTNYISDNYGTNGDFYLIFILGLYIKIDLRPAGGHRHKELMEFIEILADLEHIRWAYWQKYLHSKCTEKKNGDLVIPAELVRRWKRQIALSYTGLTEDEKESDRSEAKKLVWSLSAKKYFFKRRN